MKFAQYRDTVRNQVTAQQTKPTKTKTPTYNMTKEQLHQYKVDAYKHEAEEFQKVREALMKTATEVILNASYLVLHDRFSFGEKRLQEYQNLVEQQLDCILSGYITLDELKAARDNLNEKCRYVGVAKQDKSIIVKQNSN